MSRGSTPPRITAPFLRDLDFGQTAVVESLETDDFFADLKRVDLQRQPDLQLDKLASVLDGLVSTAVEQLGGAGWYDDLPPYDPLRGQIGLFGTLDFGLRETAHTRALAWLMNPGEAHGFNDMLLRAFLRNVFALNEDPILSGWRVESELWTESGRDRLDIYMNGSWTVAGKRESCRVIVEAKINAQEGADQCARYESYAKDAATDRLAFVFLTPEGKPPTTGSKRTRIKWTPISFIRLMALFRRHLPASHGKAGFEYLRHYMTGVLKDLYSINCGRISERDDLYVIREYLTGFQNGDE